MSIFWCPASLHAALQHEEETFFTESAERSRPRLRQPRLLDLPQKTAKASATPECLQR